jgi:hypothetical protein
MKTNKGQIMMFILFIYISLVVILIGAVIAPLGSVFSSKMYAEGAKLIQQSNTTIQSISDTEVKAELNDVFASALASQQDNITVTTNMYQYSWAFVLIISLLVIFIWTRRMVESNTSQGGFI